MSRAAQVESTLMTSLTNDDFADGGDAASWVEPAPRGKISTPPSPKRERQISPIPSRSERAAASRGVRCHNAAATRPDSSMLMTIEEARRELRMGRSYIYKLVKERKLTLVKLGRASRLRREEIERLAKQGDR
jgi:excisionase family DNA binding protein